MDRVSAIKIYYYYYYIRYKSCVKSLILYSYRKPCYLLMSLLCYPQHTRILKVWVCYTDAIDSTTGIMFGRPYGGVAILVIKLTALATYTIGLRRLLNLFKYSSTSLIILKCF